MLLSWENVPPITAITVCKNHAHGKLSEMPKGTVPGGRREELSADCQRDFLGVCARQVCNPGLKHILIPIGSIFDYIWFSLHFCSCRDPFQAICSDFMTLWLWNLAILSDSRRSEFFSLTFTHFLPSKFPSKTNNCQGGRRCREPRRKWAGQRSDENQWLEDPRVLSFSWVWVRLSELIDPLLGQIHSSGSCGGMKRISTQNIWTNAASCPRNLPLLHISWMIFPHWSHDRSPRSHTNDHES